MAKALNLRYRLPIILLCNAFVLLVGCITPLWGALLKDIRIGEYDTYTRIVLELDSEVKSPIISSTTERIKVVLSDTQPDLKRKLPMVGHRHLQDIKIQTAEPNKLSIIIQHSARILRISSFELHTPARIVLDAHWDNSASAPPAPADTLLPPPATQEPLFAEYFPDTSTFESMAHPSLSPSASIEDTLATEAIESKTVPVHDDPHGQHLQPVSQTRIIAQETETQASPVLSVQHLNSGLKANPFQIFLTIVLVTIIIAILVLLALMLLFRNHWVPLNESSSVSGFPGNRDAYIARCDTRERMSKRNDAE